jgi:ankyrin repeat protein
MMPTPETIKEFVIASHFDLAKVKAMLEEDASLLNVEHQWGPNDFESGIGAGAHVGNRAIVEFFLSQGVASNICVAAMLGNADEVKTCLDADANLANARGAHGIPVMFHAAMSGNTDVADLLRERGCTEGYGNALHGAISYGHKNMVLWLLDKGATDLEVQDYRGKTPLQNAVESNQTEIADLLRERGAQ